tara:strand:+ start:591 stop:1055 length:465 start_codon:yes stop_codon:yes gene_type:complete
MVAPHLLSKIGLRFARCVLDKSLDPEQKLWRAVVINAFDETLITQSDRKSSLIKIFAHNWIVSKSKDFKIVCEWGTLDPDDMYQCYHNALKQKQVYFTQRQVAWKKYDTIYKKMLSEENKIAKKIKRKQVDRYRQFVKDTPDIVISTIFVSAFV